MIAGGIGALFSQLVVSVILIALLILAFFRAKLASILFAVLIAWLFYPIVAMHVSYTIQTARSPFDHTRQVTGGAYGVLLPDDGSLARLRRHWSHDPAGSLTFVTRPEGLDTNVEFRISRVLEDPETRDENLPGTFDWSDCQTAQTPHGLLYIAPRSCPLAADGSRRFFAIGHVFFTPPNAPYRAVFTAPPYQDPDQMSLIYVQIEAYGLTIVGMKQPISRWRIPLEHIARQLDAHFTVLPDRFD